MVETAVEPGVPHEFELFRRRAYQLTGLDLACYKAPQMHRRLSALLTRLRIDGFAEYARVLEKDATRRQEFRDYVTINVSEFFRDAARFGELERRILPELLQRGASRRNNGAAPRRSGCARTTRSAGPSPARSPWSG